MKKRYYFLATFILILFVTIFFLNRKSIINVSKATTEIIIDARLLTENFITDEKKANNHYKNKVIEIKGTIKAINFKNNKHTILLYGSSDENHTIICDMNINLKNNQNQVLVDNEVIVKGICKGFLNDVIVLNCILINKKTNE